MCLVACLKDPKQLARSLTLRIRHKKHENNSKAVAGDGFETQSMFFFLNLAAMGHQYLTPNEFNMKSIAE